MRASTLFWLAIARTMAPTVCRCQERSFLIDRPARRSTLRARIVSTSGVPVCRTSSTMNSPLSTRPFAAPAQPIDSFNVTPRLGISRAPSESSRLMSSWSASKPRLSCSVIEISRPSNFFVMFLPFSVIE